MAISATILLPDNIAWQPGCSALQHTTVSQSCAEFSAVPGVLSKVELHESALVDSEHEHSVWSVVCACHVSIAKCLSLTDLMMQSCGAICSAHCALILRVGNGAVTGGT